MISLTANDELKNKPEYLVIIDTRKDSIRNLRKHSFVFLSFHEDNYTDFGLIGVYNYKFNQEARQRK